MLSSFFLAKFHVKLPFPYYQDFRTQTFDQLVFFRLIVQLQSFILRQTTSLIEITQLVIRSYIERRYQILMSRLELLGSNSMHV